MGGTGAPKRTSSAGALWFLGFLFFVALVLRLWGSVLGLPHEYPPDESQKLQVALALAQESYTPPGIQPGFLFYTLAAVLPVVRETGLQLAWTVYAPSELDVAGARSPIEVECFGAQPAGRERCDA